LFYDGGDIGTALAEQGGDGDQERTGSGYDDPGAADIESGLDEGLHGARAERAGKSPSGKGEESFASAGGEDELFETEHECAIGQLEAERIRSRPDDAGTEKLRDTSLLQAVKPRTVWFASPDLTAFAPIVVNQSDSLSAFGCADGGRDSGGAGADDRD
jgi:hypothetical protein